MIKVFNNDNKEEFNINNCYSERAVLVMKTMVIKWCKRSEEDMENCILFLEENANAPGVSLAFCTNCMIQLTATTQLFKKKLRWKR